MHASNYQRWTWQVAIIVTILLVGMLWAGYGPSNHCCDSTSTNTGNTTPSISSVTPVEGIVSFKATAHEFKVVGDGSQVDWMSHADDIQHFLAQGNDWVATGDATHLTLVGSVSTEANKHDRAAELQTLVGDTVVIDNQLTVAKQDASTPLVVLTPPGPAKLFFETGQTSLPASANDSLSAVIAWLGSHPETKAVISGFHDAQGSAAKNEKIAKARAQTAYDALTASGIEASRIEMRKPVLTEGTGDPSEARRVEIAIE